MEREGVTLEFHTKERTKSERGTLLTGVWWNAGLGLQGLLPKSPFAL
jgi:hypothetical protein